MGKSLLQACEERMRVARLAQSQKEKFRAICRKVMDAKNTPSAKLKNFEEELKFVVFADGNNVLLCESQYWRALLKGKQLGRLEMPVTTKQNLLKPGTAHGTPVKQNLKKLCSLTVYQAGVNDEPFLTKEQVARQIPRQLLDRAKAFTLCLKEDNYVIDSYNYFTGVYEFEVVVFE